MFLEEGLSVRRHEVQSSSAQCDNGGGGERGVFLWDCIHWLIFLPFYSNLPTSPPSSKHYHSEMNSFRLRHFYSTVIKDALYDRTVPNLRISKKTRVLCQGFTGKQVPLSFRHLLIINQVNLMCPLHCSIQSLREHFIRCKQLNTALIWSVVQVLAKVAALTWTFRCSIR